MRAMVASAVLQADLGRALCGPAQGIALSYRCSKNCVTTVRVSPLASISVQVAV